MNDIPWDKIVLSEFRYLACLTELEDKILQDWADGKSPVKSSMDRNVSERTVGEMRLRIRKKYDAVQPYSPLLPKRETDN